MAETGNQMTLDHGVLNVPLSKRGNIDAQIDAHKAQQAKAAKIAARAQRAVNVAAKAEALRLLALIPDVRMAELGKPHGMTAKQTRRWFASESHWRPVHLAEVLAREVASLAGASQ